MGFGRRQLEPSVSVDAAVNDMTESRGRCWRRLELPVSVDAGTNLMTESRGRCWRRLELPVSVDAAVNVMTVSRGRRWRQLELPVSVDAAVNVMTETGRVVIREGKGGGRGTRQGTTEVVVGVERGVGWVGWEGERWGGGGGGAPSATTTSPCWRSELNTVIPVPAPW